VAKKLKQLFLNTLYNRKGFTLIELIAVIILLMIALALGAMSLFNWLHHSEFIKNEEYAKQTYLTAQTALVNLKSDGGIESLVEDIVNTKVDGRDRAVTTLVGIADKPNYEATFNDLTYKGAGGKSIPRIFALIGTADDYRAYQNKYKGTHYVTSSGTAPELRADAELLYNLIDPYIYDKSMLYNTICVEVDVEEGAKYSSDTSLTWAINDRVVLSSAHIHSVFFSTMAKDFTYDSAARDNDIHDIISLNSQNEPEASRDPDLRENMMLGYYSVNDRGNVTDIATQKPRMKDARISNGETLDLYFSSTVTDEAEYSITLYSDGMDNPDNPVMTAKFESDGLQVSDGFARLSGTLYCSDGTVLTNFTNWNFPYTYDGYEHKITLDAMMDASAYSSSLDEADNFSITRLLSDSRSVSTSTTDVRNLLMNYVKAEIAVNKTTSDADSASMSSTVKTNKAMPLFQSVKESKETIPFDAAVEEVSYEAGMISFRHLSNIRFLDNDNEDLAFGDSNIKYTLKNAIDWTGQTNPTVMYDAAGNKLDVLKSFPTIPEFQKNWTFSTSETALKEVAIKNVYIDENSKITSASVYKDTAAECDDYKNAFGLFGVN
jgi:type II secretory pathway pseudopilin PulG